MNTLLYIRQQVLSPGGHKRGEKIAPNRRQTIAKLSPLQQHLAGVDAQRFNFWGSTPHFHSFEPLQHSQLRIREFGGYELLKQTTSIASFQYDVPSW